MAVRQYYIGKALGSFKGLSEVLDELTEEEILACLQLEAGTRRRPSVIDRLIARAVRLNELVYSRQLKEKFHGTPRIQDPDRRRNQGRDQDPEG